MFIGTKREIPYRNDYIYFLRPWQTCYDGPQRFADEALRTADDHAIIYADGTTVYPLLYEQQVKANIRRCYYYDPRLRKQYGRLQGHRQTRCPTVFLCGFASQRIYPGRVA